MSGYPGVQSRGMDHVTNSSSKDKKKRKWWSPAKIKKGSKNKNKDEEPSPPKSHGNAQTSD